MVSPAIATATPSAAQAPIAGVTPLPLGTGKQSAPPRTIWGLDPFQLYTRYWAAMGVQVVRQGEPSPIVTHAELFLLTEPKTLVLFLLMRQLVIGG